MKHSQSIIDKEFVKEYLEDDQMRWHSDYKGFSIYKQEYDAKMTNGNIVRREMSIGIKGNIRVTCLTFKDLKKFIDENY